MIKTTSLEEYKKQYRNQPLSVVKKQMLVDFDTPVSAFLKTMKKPYRFLLESVENDGQRGRYSILGDSPLVIFSAKGNHCSIRETLSGKVVEKNGNPLEILKKEYHKYLDSFPESDQFIKNGYFGYLSYDSVRYIEILPDNNHDELNLPDILLFIPSRLIVFDNLLHIMQIMHFIIPGENPEQDYQQSIDAVESTVQEIFNTPIPRVSPGTLHSEDDYSSSLEKASFIHAVKKAKNYIKRGDAFQIVLSQRLTGTTDVSPFDIYRGLRVINPSPYMFFMDMDTFSILGSSPETMVKLEYNIVTLKPIAGTRKRGTDKNDDDAIIKELLCDPKEKAEHIMLVDLGRNDMGRIAEYGSVKVENFMTTEKYSHVIHIVSSVKGVLRKGLDAVDVFSATFPAGTVSGAPKVRAMEIIDELEPLRRSIYAGAVGYLAFNGNMDVCIAIRTALCKDNKVYIQAGAGIVADSVPESEYSECLNKARGLLKAVAFAEKGLI